MTTLTLEELRNRADELLKTQSPHTPTNAFEIYASSESFRRIILDCEHDDDDCEVCEKLHKEISELEEEIFERLDAANLLETKLTLANEHIAALEQQIFDLRSS